MICSIEHDQQDAAEVGEDDEAEALDAVGAVEGRRLEHLAGHLAEGGVGREGDERDALPHDDDRQHEEERPGSISHEWLVQSLVPVIVLSRPS